MDTSEQLPSTSNIGPGDDCYVQKTKTHHPKPGTLPISANNELSKAARALLLRLLDPDPKIRLKGLRQLQQTAFYLGFNFEHVKTKKISPRGILEKQYNNLLQTEVNNHGQSFTQFDQPMIL